MIKELGNRPETLIAIAAISMIATACSTARRLGRARRHGTDHGAFHAGVQLRRPSCGRRLQDRLLERRRRGQRLPRGAGLHRQGRGARVRPGRRKITVIHHNTDAAGQLQDLRDLIAKDVDAIVFNPNDPDALNPALDEAKAAGIKTVAVDAYVTDPDTYNLYNNQVQVRGTSAPSGCSTSSAARAPSTTCAASPATRPTPTATPASRTRSPSTRTSRSCRARTASPRAGTRPPPPSWPTSSSPAASTTRIQGIWTSGMDSEVVDAIKAAGKKFVPIVGADRRRVRHAAPRPHRLSRASKGAAVTNTAAVGGAGVNLALKLLNGETVPPTAGAKPNTVLLEPIVGRQHDRRGQDHAAGLARGHRARPVLAARHHDRGLDDVHPGAGRLACKGPGE